MLKINLVCVGNIKERFFKEAQDEYVKRISKYAVLQIKELKELNYLENINQIIEQESNMIYDSIKGQYILLDISGRKMNSEEFSNFIEDISSTNSEITFVIGGSYGVSQQLKNTASKKISFSDMTFPHRLFRIMLLEQIYRAFCISNNTPYHK